MKHLSLGADAAFVTIAYREIVDYLLLRVDAEFLSIADREIVDSFSQAPKTGSRC